MIKPITHGLCLLVVFVLLGVLGTTVYAQHPDGGRKAPPANKNLPPADFRPDLQVLKIRHDVANCQVEILLRNNGATDAGQFTLYVNFAWSNGALAVTPSVNGIAKKSEFWFPVEPLDPNSGVSKALGYKTDKCTLMKSVARVEVVADPRLASMLIDGKKVSNVRVLGAGQSLSAGETVTEAKIAESNETNNSLTVLAAAMVKTP